MEILQHEPSLVRHPEDMRIRKENGVMNMTKYPAVRKYPAEVNEVATGFWITFPDFPEATVACSNREQIHELAAQCLGATISFRKEKKIDVPPPSIPRGRQVLIQVSVEMGSALEAELAFS